MMHSFCFSIPETSVYMPAETATVEDIAGMVRQSGFPFQDEEAACFRLRHKFNLLPVERAKRVPDMITEACRPLLQRLRQQQKPIQRILIARTLDLYWHEENLLRGLWQELEQKVPAVSVTQHNCATIHLAMRAAKNLFHGRDGIEGILLVTVDKAMHSSQRRLPDSLLGDCAGACYLSKADGPHRTFYIHNVVDPRMYCGLASHPDHVKWFQTTYHFTIRQMILTVLRKSRMHIDDVRLIVGSNVNYETWLAVASMLDCGVTKFFTLTIPEAGHLYCSDIIYNVTQAVQHHMLKPGDFYLSVSVGIGSYGCALHQF